MPTRTLIVLSVSPWSERARWVLDHHALAYRTEEHVPFLGERRLRRRVGQNGKRATVPVLMEPGVLLTESLDIARHAESLGNGARLFPAAREEELLRWVQVADAASSGGRALVSAAMLASPAALDESLPAEVPAFARVLSRPVTRFGMAWFARKHRIDLAALEEAAEKMREGLDALRAGLKKGAPYLLGAFSYADIAMATLLQGVKPVVHVRYPLLPATRAAWTQAALAAAYADLLEWRDAIYARHRG